MSADVIASVSTQALDSLPGRDSIAVGDVTAISGTAASALNASARNWSDFDSNILDVELAKSAQNMTQLDD